MRFRIRHETLYRYDRPVDLGPHVFRLRPREGAGLRLDSFRLAIHPAPAATETWRDADGNTIVSASFPGPTHVLRVTAESAGETGVETANGGPASIPGEASMARTMAPEAPPSPVLQEFLRAVEAEAGDAEDLAAFLDVLARRMHGTLRHISRPTGFPLDPEDTLRAGQGACRDFAALFLAGCRHRGVPARFVSGYLPAAPGQRQHMHAWAEALLPGVGWRPYDPTRLDGVGPDHIPVAAAADPAAAAPIEGVFTPRGGPARSEMIVEVVVEVGR